MMINHSTKVVLLALSFFACGTTINSARKVTHSSSDGPKSFPPLTQKSSLELPRDRSIDVRLIEVNLPKLEDKKFIEKDYKARYEWSMTIYCGLNSGKDAHVIAVRAPGLLSYWRIPWPDDCDENRNEVRLTIEANYLRCANPNIVRVAQDFAPGMMLQVDMLCQESLDQKFR